MLWYEPITKIVALIGARQASGKLQIVGWICEDKIDAVGRKRREMIEAITDENGVGDELLTCRRPRAQPRRSSTRNMNLDT